MLNPNQIENNELRRFIELHPEATMRDIIEYCREKAIDAIDGFESQDKISLDFNHEEYRRMIIEALEPFERETVHLREYDDLQYDANNILKSVVYQVEEILSSHGKDFSQRLKQILEQEFYEVMAIRPSTNYESSHNNVIANNLKETQDMDDKIATQKLDEKTRQNKQEILDRFKQLLSTDLKEHGMNLEGGRGNWSLVLDPRHQKGAQDKIEDLVIILNKSKDLFRENLLRVLLMQNDRIFEDFKKIRRDYMAIIEEAMIQTAKEKSRDEEQGYLSTGQETSESTKNKKTTDSIFYGDKINDSQIGKENPQGNNYWLGDMDAFSKISIRPKDETIEVFAEKGISAEEASAYIWDRFVRMQMITEAFDANKISKEEREQQLSYVDRIEELLFKQLMAGKTVDEARFSVEIAVAKEIDFGIISMDSNEFWKSGDANIFSTVGILPDKKTIEELNRQGLKENQIPTYVWDTYCRTSRVLIAFENGRITEEEKNVQFDLVDKVQRRIFNELCSGKSLEEAREIAEVEVGLETYNQERNESNEAAAGKSGLEDVTEDPYVKISDVQDVAKTFSNEQTPKDKEKLDSDLIK